MPAALMMVLLRRARLAYLENPADLVRWVVRRGDERVEINCSTAGWDSVMICYAAIVATPDRG
jgi:hypothetical protein